MSAQPVATTASLPGLRPRVRRALGDPTPLACTVAKAAMEAVLGGPAIDPYVRWLDEATFAHVARQRSLAIRAGRTLTGPVGVRRARASRVSRTAAEVSVVIEHAGRCRAAALRLEEVAGRWQVTELLLG
ncbi:Rv3235 family protein [Demequina sp. NBRC 110056]|uniref:Rv3235 family protein n=1 Tax=Demequina sp. NBRC 110056 TaxID=1570345 RepID=UPI000A05E74C|nr:Rv3235 family protein [Demequina sp. NBRC 110056]